jgi:hypothetical protein
VSEPPIRAHYVDGLLNEVYITKPELVQIEHMGEGFFLMTITMPNGVRVKVQTETPPVVTVDTPGTTDRYGEDLRDQPKELVVITEGEV